MPKPVKGLGIVLKKKSNFSFVRRPKAALRSLSFALPLVTLMALTPAIGVEIQGKSVTSETTVGEILDLAAAQLGLSDPESVTFLVNLYVRGGSPGQITWVDSSVSAIRGYNGQFLLWLYLRDLLGSRGFAKPDKSQATLDRLADIFEYSYRTKINPKSDEIYLPVNVNVGLVGETVFGRSGAVIIRFDPITTVNLSAGSADVATIENLPKQLKFGFGQLSHIDTFAENIPADEIDTYIAEVVRRNPGESSDTIVKGSRSLQGYNGRLSCNFVEKPSGSGYAVVNVWDCSFRLNASQIGGVSEENVDRDPRMLGRGM